MQQALLVLTEKQIRQRIERIAFQIYEDNLNEKELILAGIANKGFVFAKALESVLKNICPIPVRLIEIRLDKEMPTRFEIIPAIVPGELSDKVIILVDDVLNSGKTLLYSLRPFLDADLRKIRTALLVNRDHKRYPVEADFVGITISTTLQEHVRVELEPGKAAVYLE